MWVDKAFDFPVDFYKSTFGLYVLVGLRQKLFSVLFPGGTLERCFIVPDLELSGVEYFPAHLCTPVLVPRKGTKRWCDAGS